MLNIEKTKGSSGLSSESELPKTLVPSVMKAVAVLRYLGDIRTPAGLSTIARDLDVSPSSCLNILRTLVVADLVEFDEQEKTYILGLGVLELSRRALAKADVFASARPQLLEIVQKYRTTGGVWRVAPGERLVLIGLIESESEMRIHMEVGQRLPVLAGANGRCLAAVRGMSVEEIRDRFNNLRSYQSLSLEAYIAEVDEARRLGWAIDSNIFVQGVTTIAAPVVDEQGEMRFSVSNTMFTGQHSHSVIDRIGSETRDLARELSRRLFGARI